MRKFLIIFLAFVIMIFSIFPYVHAENNIDSNQTNTTNNTTGNTAVENLQNERNEIQNQMDEANGQLEGVQNDLTQNLQQVQKLDERISESEQELNDLNNQIANLQSSIDEVQMNLETAQISYDSQKQLLDNYLVAVQESNDTEYLDVLLSSKNISEFLSSYFLISELASYEMDLLDDMQNKKNEIELSKVKLEQDREKLATIKANQSKTATILENTKTVRENFISKLSDKEKEIQTQIDEYNTRFEEINKEILELAQGSIAAEYIGGELAWPVPGYTKITSNYGMRVHPITGVYKLHTGIDIPAPIGTSFLAANDGIVVKAGYNTAYGNMVIIDHGGGVQTLYAHGDQILVQLGQTVAAGTEVLKVGSTGYSTGPHAHFEIRVNGQTVNPLNFLLDLDGDNSQNEENQQDSNDAETNTNE